MTPKDSIPSIAMLMPEGRDHQRSAYLLEGERSAEPVIHIKIGRNPVLHLTLEEARLMRDFIDALLSVDSADDSA